jgi:hypothetical protein
MPRSLTATFGLLLALTLATPSATEAQTASSVPSPDRWQLTRNDHSYIWNVRLVRLNGDTLIARTTDSLVAVPLEDLSEIQLLGETVLKVGDGHRSGVGALGDNTSPILAFAQMPLTERRQRIRTILEYEASRQ